MRHLRLHRALFFVNVVLCAERILCRLVQYGIRNTGQQPHWITPLATTTPRLEQEFCYDIQWQTHNSGVTTDNYGVSKGLEIIPAKNVEVISPCLPTSRTTRDSPHDGFGDWQFVVKYRIAAGREEHENYILTAFYQMTFPTGQYLEGTLSPVLTPTIA